MKSIHFAATCTNCAEGMIRTSYSFYPPYQRLNYTTKTHPKKKSKHPLMIKLKIWSLCACLKSYSVRRNHSDIIIRVISLN